MVSLCALLWTKHDKDDIFRKKIFRSFYKSSLAAIVASASHNNGKSNLISAFKREKQFIPFK